MKDRIEERRTLKRRHLLVYPDVIDAKTREVLGRLGDISSEGLLIVSRKALPLDEMYTVSIPLPDIRGFQGDVIGVQIQTCWSSPDINDELADTGCKFINPDKETLSLVANLIKFLGFTE